MVKDLGETFCLLRDTTRSSAWRYLLDSIMLNLDLLAQVYDLPRLLDWAKQAEEYLKGEQQTGESPSDALRKFLNADPIADSST